MAIRIEVAKHAVESDSKFRLKDHPTQIKPVYASKEEYEAILEDHVHRLSELQEVHAATGEYALLIIVQAMDTAGKDGVIRHVMSGVNPQGCDVYSFKQPSPEELKHDFLWRTTLRLPERGKIGIFNRSYYEEVLAVRVHPEFLDGEGLPKELVSKKSIWKERYKSISHFERHLFFNGTRVLKFYLHLSKEEQQKRLLARIDQPEKNWKFSLADVKEREFWDDYMEAFQDAIRETSSEHAPWWIVPADDKRTARLIVSQVILDTLDSLKLRYPKTTAARAAELAEMRKRLES